tara:strand:+ start:236 stop:427 length:192 start_codon:yes stop_codon:yes gene_type:complete
MAELLNYAVPIAMGAVVLVLLLGLINMMKNGSASRSQSLMRWRVGLQFVAVILVMTAFYFTSA